MPAVLENPTLWASAFAGIGASTATYFAGRRKTSAETDEVVRQTMSSLLADVEAQRAKDRERFDRERQRCEEMIADLNVQLIAARRRIEMLERSS